MSFAHLSALYLLWLVPLAAFLIAVGHRRKARALEQIADPPLLARIAGNSLPGRKGFKASLILAAIALMLLGLAGPRWGTRYEEVQRKGVDVMFAVDVSRSMLVEDVQPNRLERARREILDFIDVATGDRVGLTAFAGAAFTQCPLTLDYEALRMFLHALGPDLLPVPGTDLGAAIQTAASAFDDRDHTDKVIILITDGEDHESRGLESAKAAAQNGIRLFVYGIGDPTGGPIPAEEGGGFLKDQDGNLVLSKLDEDGLRRMAEAAGGAYVRSVAGDLDLDLLYFEGIKPRTEARTLKSGKIKVQDEQFAVFLGFAALLLIVEGLIPQRRTP